MQQEAHNKLMNQYPENFQRKSKRNFSDIDNHYSNSLPLYQHQPRKNAIKINKNKLPSDFFPRSDSSKKKITSKIKLKQDPQYQIITTRKAQSQRIHISPQKTSFFGFFQEEIKNSKKKNIIQPKMLNRKFQTRQEPKRQPIIDFRHYTPITNSQRSDLLQLFPATYDNDVGQMIISSTRGKNMKIVRKQNITKYRQVHQDPQQRREESLTYRKSGSTNKNNLNGYLETENNNKAVDAYNMTFFNGKSICFPPVSSKNLSHS